MEIGIKSQLFLEKPEAGIFIPINWFDSCNDNFLPVWNSHCTESGSQLMSCSDELTVHSCPLLCLQRRVAKVASGLFYCWSLSRNNTMATDLQKFTLYYGSRRFVAWDCWTHTSWQVMQRDSDMLIAVSHVRLYFVKRSTTESIAMLQQVWKIHYWCECDHCAWVSNYTYAGFFSCSIKLRGSLEYICAGLREYVLIVKA